MSPPCDGDDSVFRCTCVSGENGGFHGENDTRSDDRNCPYCRKSNQSNSFLKLYLSSEKDSEKLWRIITASAKGFAIGAGLKGGLAVFSILARLRSRSNSASSRKVGKLSNGEAVVMAAKETLRYGLFLGSFAGTFVSVDECIATLGGHRRTAHWRALFAGPSMLLTGTNTQHTSLAIYILMRAAVLASRCGIKSKRFGRICKPLTWSHGDIFLMCISSSQILSAYILNQDSLPPSYKSFLNKHGGKDISILQGVKEIACGIPFSNLEGIEKHYKSMGVNIKLDPEMKVPCSIIHGHQPCVSHIVSFLIQAYGRALPVYLPIYLFPALIVHRQDLLKRSYMGINLVFHTCFFSYSSLWKSTASLSPNIFVSRFNSSSSRSTKKVLFNSGKGSSWYCKIKLISLCILFICLDVDLCAVQDFQKLQYSISCNGNVPNEARPCN